MKKLLIFFTISIAFLSCKENAIKKIDYVLFSGKIENTNTDSIKVIGSDFKKSIALSKDGTFSDTLHILENGYYRYYIDKEATNVYLKIGDSIHVTLNTTEFDETLAYTGKGASANNYLAKKFLNNESLNISKLYLKEEEKFKVTVDSIKNENLALLNAQKDLDEEFKEVEKTDIHYDCLSYVSNYKSYHPYFAKKEDYKVSDSFLPEELKNIKFNDLDKYKKSPAYKNMAISNFSNAVFDSLGMNYKEASVSVIKSVIDSVELPILKNDLIEEIYDMLLSPSNPNGKELSEYFLLTSNNDKLDKSITNHYEKVKLLTKGNKSPTFNFENYKGGKTTLTDLKGKYVYIDVWATWCGPCIMEIPSLKAIEKEYHDKSIEFVSISIDKKSDYEKWKKMIASRELGGIQLFADNDWDTEFVKSYNIKGIPRFILIDPDGKIVSSDAPRPSNPKLKELFTSLEI